MILLCEADLTGMKVFNNTWEVDRDYKCKQVLGRNGPDESRHVATAHGYKIPVGPIKRNEKVEGWWGNDYSEFVQAEEDRVRVRYVVSIGTKSRGHEEEFKGFVYNADEECHN